MDLELPSHSFLPRRQAGASPHPPMALAHGATLRLSLPRGACIDVASGRIWLTETGDPDDHFVAAGGCHVVRRGGRVVIEGDSQAPARLRVTRR